MNWIKQYGFTLFRWAVALFCFAFLGYKIYYSGSEFSSAVQVISDPGNLLLLIFIIAMMLVNWAIEAVKWKTGAAVIEKISFVNSFSSVLAGIAVSMAGPNRTGEFLGRVTALKKENRVAGSFVSVHISLAQTAVTIIAGALALLIIDPSFFPVKVNSVALYVFLIGLIILSLIVYFRFADLYKLLKRKPFSGWFKKTDFEGITISNKVLTINLLLSVFRYAVFISQFVLTFRIFGIVSDITDLYLCSALIYLIMAVIPSFALAELGIRGTVAVYVMALFSVSSAPVIAASTLIWVVNIAVPAVAGAVILALRK